MTISFAICHQFLDLANRLSMWKNLQPSVERKMKEDPAEAAKKRILREPMIYMRLVGCWPENRWRITELLAKYLYPKVFIVVSSLTLVYLYTDGDGNIVEILTNFGDAFAGFICYTKFSTLLKYEKQLLSTRKFLQNDFSSYEEPISKQAASINRRFQKRASSVCFWYLWVYAPVTLSGLLINWTSALNDGPQERRFNTSFPRYILANDYFYWPVFVIFNLLFYVFLFSSGGFDIMFVSLCLQIKCKTEILMATLRFTASSRDGYAKQCERLSVKVLDGIPPENAPFDLEDEKRTVINRDLPNFLVSCVKYHHLIISLRDRTEMVFARTCLYQMFYILVSLGVPAVRMLKDPHIDVANAVFIGFYAVWNFGQLLFFCWFGDLVPQSSEAVADAAWEVYRHGTCVRSKVVLQMMIIRAQKPLYLTADRFVYLTRRLYLDVMRKSQSLYSAIFNMR